MRLGVVITADGQTSVGRLADPTETVGSVSLVRRIIETFHQINADLLVVVYSAQRFPELRKQVSKMEALCLDGGDVPEEMLEFTKVGLRYLLGKCDRIFLTTVDTPFFTADTLRALAASDAPISSPVFQGHAGHPILLDASIIPLILDYNGTDGLRGLLRTCGERRAFIATADRGILCNIKTEADLPGAVQTHNQKNLHPSVRLRLAKERPFFGPGAAQLLSCIEETESVRLACQQMGISYSKGWKILTTMEEQTGLLLVSRQQGGKNGGAAYLTLDGRDLLEKFSRFESRCKALIQQEFDAIFLP